VGAAAGGAERAPVTEKLIAVAVEEEDGELVESEEEGGDKVVIGAGSLASDLESHRQLKGPNLAARS